MKKLKRLIPVLLLDGNRVIKTKNFMGSRYIGDPINIIKIFNDKEVDEICILDITSTKTKRQPNFELLEEIAGECFMPISYGGGIKNEYHIKKIINLGIEKLIFDQIFFEKPLFIKKAVDMIGSSGVIVCLDIYFDNKTKSLGLFDYLDKSKRREDLQECLNFCEKLQVGEVIFNLVERDGTKRGLDFKIINKLSAMTDLSKVVIGGLKSLSEVKRAFKMEFNAVGAGGFFVYHGSLDGILISYPKRILIEKIIK